jgi:LysM repeat protein
MESLKPILLCVVLAGVGYAVYIALNHAPPPEPALSNAPEWGKPSVEIGKPSSGKPAESTPPATGKVGDTLQTRGANILEKVQQPSTGASAPSTNSTPAAPTVSLPFGIGSASLSAAAQSAKSPDANANAANAHSMPTGDPFANPGLMPPSGVQSPAQASGVDPVARHEFEAAMRSAQTMANEGKLAEALRELSRWYDHPIVAPEEQVALVDFLGQLAGSVIYSQQHLLIPAYQVQAGDTLETVAMQYQIPWQLLAKINGIGNSRTLTPGEALKVIRGPFNAQLNCQQDYLALFVDGLYAGRFPVQGGKTLTKPDGPYAVAKFAADNPTNQSRRPYISLGGDLYLFVPDNSTPPAAGSLGISQRDMEDVFDMLSERSKVTIRR